jgi:hypothetical protein
MSSANKNNLTDIAMIYDLMTGQGQQHEHG